MKWWFWRRGKSQPERKYFLSSETQSNERVRKLGLRMSGKGVTGFLDLDKIRFPGDRVVAGHDEENMQEYKGDPGVDWIVEVEPGGSGFFVKEELKQIFDLDWRTRFRGGIIYVYSLTSPRWTFLSYDEPPERYGKMQLAIKLLSVYSKDEVVADEVSGDKAGLSPKRLIEFLMELEHRIKRRYPKAVIREQEPLAAALEKAARLLAVKKELNQDVLIVLRSESIYSGKNVWEALIDAGFEWGDGDLFHWRNRNRDHGDENFASVWTTSPPGYFFPEAIVAGKHNFQDLLFGYSIPRNADPVAVFDMLVPAVEFCRKQLGGALLGRDGGSFDREKERAALLRVVEGLEANGMVPGSHAALRRF